MMRFSLQLSLLDHCNCNNNYKYAIKLNYKNALISNNYYYVIIRWDIAIFKNNDQKIVWAINNGEY